MQYVVGLLLTGLSAISRWLFTIALTYISWFTKRNLFNVALVAAMVLAVGTATTIFIDYLSSQVSALLTELVVFSFIPFYLPSNLSTCIGIYVAVRSAGTIYNRTMNFIEQKSYILKA